MTRSNRPRVAAIGLDKVQTASIKPLCEDLREAYSLDEYLKRYSWTETDVLVASFLRGDVIDNGVNFLMIGPNFAHWSDSYSSAMGTSRHYATTLGENTERELSVPPTCPDLYKPLANELARQLSQASDPCSVVKTSRQTKIALIKTTSGHPVALRLLLSSRSKPSSGHETGPIALLLPIGSSLATWFSAFLTDVHESDPLRVPHAPPRLLQPSDWYTPEERSLVNRIAEIDSMFERLQNERHDIETKLLAEGESAEQGIRRAIWADGNDLVTAVIDLLSDLGFEVRDMDEERSENEPKREDLRLTLQDLPSWEALVEVKGYPSGTKTNDARQIREHRDLYIREDHKTPDLTLWLANPYREMDPSSRPATDQNVGRIAESIGAVHVLSTDLYRQWSLVAAGKLDKDVVIKSLVDASPGLWTPPVANITA